MPEQWLRAPVRRLRSWTLQEPQIERPEHQNNSDVCYQPLREVVPEEQDVHADHDGYERERVKHDGCLSSHRLSMCQAQGFREGRTSSFKRVGVVGGVGAALALGLQRVSCSSHGARATFRTMARRIGGTGV